MSYLTAEQMVAAHKANVETLFGLTQKAFEGVEKLVELNIQVAKTAMVEAADTTKAALSVKDAQELLALQQAMLQPTAEKAAAYGRHVYEIATSTNSEVAKVAEAQLADVQGKFMALVDTAVKNAPAGTENAVTLVKSAVAAANNAFETVQKAAKQASVGHKKLEEAAKYYEANPQCAHIIANLKIASKPDGQVGQVGGEGYLDEAEGHTVVELEDDKDDGATYLYEGEKFKSVIARIHTKGR